MLFWTQEILDVVSREVLNFLSLVVLIVTASGSDMVILRGALRICTLSSIIGGWSSWDILRIAVWIEFKWNGVVVEQLLNNVVSFVLLTFLQKTISLQHHFTTFSVIGDHNNSEFRWLLFLSSVRIWILIFILILIRWLILKAVHSRWRCLHRTFGLNWNWLVWFSELFLSVGVWTVFAKLALAALLEKGAKLSFVIVVRHIHQLHHEVRG